MFAQTICELNLGRAPWEDSGGNDCSLRALQVLSLRLGQFFVFHHRWHVFGDEDSDVVVSFPNRLHMGQTQTKESLRK